MDIVRQAIALLNKPFPEDESRFGAPRTILIISLFITFFLFIFGPFGIETLGSEKFLVCVGFGSMTFFATVVYEFIIGEVLKLKGEREQWTFWKWIVNNLGIMFSISLANFLFARLVLFGYIDWSLYPQMLYATFMIGIIPVVVLGGWSLMRQERKYQDIADEINHQKIGIPENQSKDEDSIFDIPLSQIKFAEALQNYVKIGHIDTHGQFATKTERATLKQILNETEGSPIVKCHRSFLVNQQAITSTEGNAQGLLLTLSDCETTIPVSRSYVGIFREK